MPRDPRRAAGRAGHGSALAGLATLLMLSLVLAPASVAQTSTPALQLARTIRTTPFAGSSVSMGDGEGSAYVPADDSLWLADDNADAVYEIDPTTGELKRTIDSSAFEATPRFGGGSSADKERVVDFESIAYDADDDALFVFSGVCCNSSSLPTVFRLTRRSGVLKLDSYQPLSADSDFSASGWNPADGKLYVGAKSDLRSYDYATNTDGPTFQIANVTGILGLGFSTDGAQAYLVTNHENLDVVDWTTRTIVPGWSFDLTPFGMLDARAVDRIGDQFYVLDGEERPAGDPLRFAVFVFDVVQAEAVTASFTATPSSGRAPLTVRFHDTSTGGPTSWLWDFGDGTTSALADPAHEYATPGTYVVELTAGNSFGSSSAQATVRVLPVECDGTAATVVGTRRSDVLRGTSGPDVIQGRGGDDLIRGKGGNDLICGGGGADRLIGGDGRDRLFGQRGEDFGNGGPGDDTCRGIERRRSC